jgi:hypothetical protein
MITVECANCAAEKWPSSLRVIIGAGRVSVVCGIHGRIAELVSTGDDNNLNLGGLRINLAPSEGSISGAMT